MLSFRFAQYYVWVVLKTLYTINRHSYLRGFLVCPQSLGCRHDAEEGSQLVYIPQLLFRVKKEWLDTRKDIPDWSRVRRASFFTRCISPGSSATPCLIWLRWRLGPLHTDSYAGITTNHNYLNISIIRKMLANSYIISKTKVSQLLYSIQS